MKILKRFFLKPHFFDAVLVFTMLTSALMLVVEPFEVLAQDKVTFQLDMRVQMMDRIFQPQQRQTVGVRGSIPPLRWDSTLVATDEDGDSVYTVTLTLLPPKNAFFEENRLAYKFKIDGDNVYNRGWEMSENSTLNLTGGAQTVRRYFNVAERTPAFVSGSPRVKKHDNFTSKVLRNRSLYVLLPKGYDTSKTRYPVLYMHDGQNMFDDSTAANGEWHLDEVAEGLTDAKRIPPMIIVAVSVPPERRFEEYTPTPIQRPTPTGGTVSLGGRAELHAKMMVKEIKPFIDSTYRTLTDRANTALGGSSLGGLITLYTGAKYPKLFGTLFAISPSVWWDKKQILNILTKEAPTMRKSAKEPPRIWLDIGDQEGKEALEGARELKSLLLNKGWKAGTTLHFMEAPNAAHSESAWANRLEPMLTTMFGKNTQKK